MKRTAWFTFFIIMAASCLDEPDCFNLTNNIAGISFRVMGSTKADTVRLVNVILPGASGEFTDYSMVVTNGVIIPLNFHENQTQIVFEKPDGFDTLVLGYRVQSQFVSEDCGSKFVLSNLQVLEQTFDSLRLVNATLGTNDQARNIEVYRCPVTHVVAMQMRQLVGNSTSTQAAAVLIEGITADFLPDIFYPQSLVSTVYLPVNTSTSTTSYTFALPDGSTKQVVVNYTVTPQTRYAMCGEQPFVSGLELVNSEFDSAGIADDEKDQPRTTLLDPHDVNVYLFQCPNTNLARIAFKTFTTPGSTATRTDTINLSKIRTDYLPDPILYNNAALTTVNVPLNPAAIESTFYLDYTNGSIDTVALRYTTNPRTFFQACGSQLIFSDLIEFIEKPYVRIVKDSVQFPAITNLEIVH